MARPGRPERNREARSFRQLRRFHHVSNSDKVFGTHRPKSREETPNEGSDSVGWGGTPLPHVPSKMIAISGSIERRETSGIQRGRGTDTKVYGPRADRTEDTKGMAGVRPQRLRRTARDASRRRGSQGRVVATGNEGIHRAHSGNPAFRSPSIISFAFVCPPRAIHADIVKTGSSPSRCAAASRASASRPRWAKADARQR
jgi:hypothetical protein